jgi:hypothetical protein
MTVARATAKPSTPIWWLIIVEVSMNQAYQAEEGDEDNTKRPLEADSHCRPGRMLGANSNTG